jgi:hypothetical protein
LSTAEFGNTANRLDVYEFMRLHGAIGLSMICAVLDQAVSDAQIVAWLE